jgi:hypothetical protein
MITDWCVWGFSTKTISFRLDPAKIKLQWVILVSDWLVQIRYMRSSIKVLHFVLIWQKHGRSVQFLLLKLKSKWYVSANDVCEVLHRYVYIWRRAVRIVKVFTYKFLIDDFCWPIIIFSKIVQEETFVLFLVYVNKR